MAKRPALPPPEAIRALIDSRGRLAVRVTPNARQVAITLPVSEGDVLNVRVNVVPEDGKANAAVIALIAEALGVAKTSICVTQGHTSRNKILIVSD